MPNLPYDAERLKQLDHLLGYFDAQVLASYRNEPHKYAIEVDDFRGELRTTEEYFYKLLESDNTEESISVRFGYRTLEDGNLAIVAWLPDLVNKSPKHVNRWAGFKLVNPNWSNEFDQRFNNWIKRYIEGSWEIKDGPSPYLQQTLRKINALTIELINLPLYKHEIDKTLSYPSAENSHRYQDAHKEIYGYLIDGLDKDCISRLATKLGKTIKVGDKKTVEALQNLFPKLASPSNFHNAMDLVSQQRRLAAHGKRPLATDFPAFSQFTKDLALCLEGIKEVLNILENEFGIDGKQAYKRYEAKKWLPKITEPPMPHYSIIQALDMKGKTIARVEIGSREHREDMHESEAIIIYFTDDSVMSIHMGNNVSNLLNEENILSPDEFQVDFIINWVPPLQP